MSTLGPAAPADALLLARIHGQCFDDAWSEDAFRNFLSRANCLAFVAASAAGSTTPDAFILVQVAAEECEILSLGVLPGVRRQGLARALVKAAAAAAQTCGAAQMFLEVAEDNVAARALYEGLGFTALGRRRNYYRAKDGRGIDALTFRAALPL